MSLEILIRELLAVDRLATSALQRKNGQQGGRGRTVDDWEGEINFQGNGVAMSLLTTREE